MKTSLRLVAAAAALVSLSGAAFAQATIKQSTITSWPYVISQPGSYKLVGNISVPADMSGFKITAPGATLDLNGFTIAGPVTCPAGSSVCSSGTLSTVNGIVVEAAGVTLRNGTVRGFRGAGVTATNQQATTIENIVAMHNSTAGFVAIASSGDQNASARISGSMAVQNGNRGFVVTSGLIERSIAKLNGGIGFSLTQAVLMDSRADRNWVGMSGGQAKGVVLYANANGNRGNTVTSMGGNLDGTTPF